MKNDPLKEYLKASSRIGSAKAISGGLPSDFAYKRTLLGLKAQGHPSCCLI